MREGSKTSVLKEEIHCGEDDYDGSDFETKVGRRSSGT
jgi:hypothetical protein